LLQLGASVAAKESTALFRAVGPAELADIGATNSFRNLGSAEGKYFTTSAESAASYAKQAVSAFGDAPYAIIRAEVPNSSFSGLSRVTVDHGGIPAWVIRQIVSRAWFRPSWIIRRYLGQMKPQAIILVRFFLPSEGGRKTAIKGNFYACPMFIGEDAFDCRLLLEGRSIELGEYYEVPVSFLDPKVVVPKLVVNGGVYLWEGKKVADGKITHVIYSA
jgi:hypothetical protein